MVLLLESILDVHCWRMVIGRAGEFDLLEMSCWTVRDLVGLLSDGCMSKRGRQRCILGRGTACACRQCVCPSWKSDVGRGRALFKQQVRPWRRPLAERRVRASDVSLGSARRTAFTRNVERTRQNSGLLCLLENFARFVSKLQRSFVKKKVHTGWMVQHWGDWISSKHHL